MSVCVGGVAERLLTHPDSAGLPDSESLPPTTCSSLGWLQGGGAAGEGRGGTADTGEPGPVFTPGRYCTRENVSTKDHMAPFCIEPLDKGVEGGRGSCQKAHFQGAPAPPTSDSRLAALGEWGHLFPLGWVPVMLLPSLPHGHTHRDGFCHHVLPISTLLAPCTAPLGRKGEANSVFLT